MKLVIKADENDPRNMMLSVALTGIVPDKISKFTYSPSLISNSPVRYPHLQRLLKL